MGFDKPYIQKFNPNESVNNKIEITRTIYYGEVISIDDPTEGGRIKVKVKGFDERISSENLPWSHPMLPKFFHIYPQVGEIVQIFISDTRFPQRNRYWLGSVVSQPHKIGFDSSYTALSTSNEGIVSPEKAPSSYPEAVGVFPLKTDVGLVGKVNTDVILRKNEVHLRAGKHVNNCMFCLNTKNPAQLSLIFEENAKTCQYESKSVLLSDKIALISHSGTPKFKAAGLSCEDRDKIFTNAHPVVRGDVLVAALEVVRKTIIGHIHGYSGIPADKDAMIKDLEKIDFTSILQENIVIN